MFSLPADTQFVRFKEFVTSGSSNNDTGKVFGSLETKYKYADYGKQTTRAPNSRPRKPSYDSDKI